MMQVNNDASKPKPKAIKAALTYGTFPLVFGSVMGIGVYGMARGWDPVVTAMSLTAVVVFLLLVLERVHPYQREWLRSHGDIRTDLIHNLVNFWIPEVYAALFVGAFTLGAAWLSDSLGMTLWPSNWPLLGQLLLALVIGELGTYSIHRAMHESEFLWRFHAAHHSAPRLYWLNAGRFHPVDLFAQQFLGVTPLVLLGADLRIIALHTLFTAVHGMFQHCNIDIRLGPLNWFLHGGASPLASLQAHRRGQHQLRRQYHLVGYCVPLSVLAQRSGASI